MKKGSFYMALLFAILGLAGIIQSLTFRYWEAMTLPVVLSGLMFIGAIVEIKKEFTNKPAPAKGETEGSLNQSGIQLEARAIMLLMGWIILFIIGIWLLGLLIAVPLFAGSYLKWRKRSWLVSVIYAIAADIIIYFAFEVLLRTELYRGLFFGG